jgi:hypothetical protein
MSCCGGSSGSGSGGASLGNVKVAVGSVTNYGASTRQTIGVGGGFAFVNVLRVKLKHTGGSAANFTPRLYNAVAALAGSINQQFVGSTTVVADLFDVATVGCVLRTDASGQFYLEPGPGAGADNAFDYEIYFEVL